METEVFYIGLSPVPDDRFDCLNDILKSKYDLNVKPVNMLFCDNAVAAYLHACTSTFLKEKVCHAHGLDA